VGRSAPASGSLRPALRIERVLERQTPPAFLWCLSFQYPLDPHRAKRGRPAVNPRHPRDPRQIVIRGNPRDPR
jgi:hypothetical protein